MTNGALTIRSIVKEFRTPEGGTMAALDHVDLDVEGGSFFVLLGPSGCGKTTLLRCLAGLENPNAGTIHLDAERLDTVPPFKRRVSTVFQSYALFPHMTVADNISFGLEMAGTSRKAARPRVDEMLSLVQLDGYAQRKPSQLSGGQQQRVALARALAISPQVLLLDEPLAALDLKLRRGMQTELKRLQRTTGVTFVFVTHDQEEALSMGDRVAVFDRGRIAQVGTPAEIYESPTVRFVADFIGETSFLELRPHDGGVGQANRLGLADGSVANTCVDGALLPGATVSVRPERVRLHAEPSAGRGDVGGTVTEVTYLGADLRVMVTLSDGQRVMVRHPAIATPPTLDDAAQLTFEPGALRPVAL